MFSFSLLNIFVSPQVSTAWRDQRLRLRCKLHPGTFVQLATTASGAAASPHLVQLASTGIRLGEKAKATATDAPLVKREMI